MATINNPNQAYLTLDNDQNELPYRAEEFVAGEALEQGDLVYITLDDGSPVVNKTPTDLAEQRVLGSVMRPAAEGGTAKVITGGYAAQVKVHSAANVSAGNFIKRSGDTAGTIADTATVADAVGYAVRDEADDRADVWFFGRS